MMPIPSRNNVSESLHFFHLVAYIATGGLVIAQDGAHAKNSVIALEHLC